MTFICPLVVLRYLILSNTFLNEALELLQIYARLLSIRIVVPSALDQVQLFESGLCGEFVQSNGQLVGHSLVQGARHKESWSEHLGHQLVGLPFLPQDVRNDRL